MKKILSLVCLIIMLGLMLILLTGCGASSNNITDELNNVVKEEVAEWKEDGYGRTFGISVIQSALNKKDSPYKIVASGDVEFTKAPDFTEYKESNISGYEGKSHSQTRMMEKEFEVNYLVVYDSENKKYYNVDISYEIEKLGDAEKEYPVFKNAKEIK